MFRREWDGKEVWSDSALFIWSHRSCMERRSDEGNLDYERMPVPTCLLLLPLSVIHALIYPPLSVYSVKTREVNCTLSSQIVLCGSVDH